MLFVNILTTLLRGRVARKFNNEPNWNKGKDARFLASGQRPCTRLIKKHP